MKIYFKEFLTIFSSQSNLKFALLIIASFFLFNFSKCSVENKTNTPTQHFEKTEKQSGAHFFSKVDSTGLAILKSHNFNWVTYVPFGDQKDYDSPTMRFGFQDSLRFLRRDSMLRNNFDLTHQAGFKILLKPHVWIGSPSDGKWRSDIFPNNEKDWESWSKSYREFILYYAEMAEKKEVELFCIGTEFSRLTLEKPEFWRELIREVRTIYKGKITYAANWYKEYEHIEFWDELDFIGVQAYFPLSKIENPSVGKIISGWQPHISAMEKISEKFNKQILFTELGYKNTTDSAITPWEWPSYDENHTQVFSNETQANCYHAFFKTVWKKNWFAGVHIWQWRTNKSRREEKFSSFDPHRKPAGEVIKEGFLVADKQ